MDVFDIDLKQGAVGSNSKHIVNKSDKNCHAADGDDDNDEEGEDDDEEAILPEVSFVANSNFNLQYFDTPENSSTQCAEHDAAEVTTTNKNTKSSDDQLKLIAELGAVLEHEEQLEEHQQVAVEIDATTTSPTSTLSLSLASSPSSSSSLSSSTSSSPCLTFSSNISTTTTTTTDSTKLLLNTITTCNNNNSNNNNNNDLISTNTTITTTTSTTTTTTTTTTTINQCIGSSGIIRSFSNEDYINRQQQQHGM